MLAGFPGHADPIDIPKSMIQLHPVRFVSALDGTPTLWNPTLLSWDPLHIGSDR